MKAIVAFVGAAYGLAIALSLLIGLTGGHQSPLIALGYLVPLDHAQLPNFTKNVDPTYTGRIHFTSAINIYARVQGDPHDILPVLRERIRQTDSNLIIANMNTVADLIHQALSAEGAESAVEKVKAKVLELCGRYPLPH